ncbi:MAG: N-acetyltransferase [Clostridia bacterium]|nr:N-acetyltransferase [Clostridia bacterium]
MNLIKLLDNKNIEVAEQIIKLQKASYQVEAEIIGFIQIPPLLENPEDIINSEETYYGYFVEQDLAGIISYSIEADVLDICKVAVHPDFFKRGIATQLIRLVEQTEGINKILVFTGLKNSPAVTLYTALGFIKMHEREVAKGVFIVSFEKQLSKSPIL